MKNPLKSVKNSVKNLRRKSSSRLSTDEGGSSAEINSSLDSDHSTPISTRQSSDMDAKPVKMSSSKGSYFKSLMKRRNSTEHKSASPVQQSSPETEKEFSFSVPKRTDSGAEAPPETSYKETPPTVPDIEPEAIATPEEVAEKLDNKEIIAPPQAEKKEPEVLVRPRDILSEPEASTPSAPQPDQADQSEKAETAPNETVPEVKEASDQQIREIHGRDLVKGLLACTAILWLFVIWLFGGAGVLETILWSLMALLGSLGYCFLYDRNLRTKQMNLEVLRTTPGVNGLRLLLNKLPTWLSYTKSEKVEWLNKAMEQMWPSYDKAVSASIIESVEPMLQQLKPPIFKDIRFTRLNFGNVPFRFEGVEVYDITESEMVLDVDIRWSGDSNITLAIEPNLPGIIDVTRMTPKLTDISCYGTMRMIFKPLVSEMPGFGAVIVTFVRPPTVRFKIDFGKALGGNYSGKMVTNALDSFIKETMVNMYVWPQRYVVPMIYDEAITGPLEDLQLRHVGLITVKIVEARDLPAADMNGTSDPTIEIWSRPERKYSTAVSKNTLNPIWDDEVHHLLIQEPRSQNISLVAYDVDLVNISEMFKSFNIVKSMRESLYAREFLGRTSVDVRVATEKPGVEVDGWYDFGASPFGHPEGCGVGKGTVHLKMTYTPFAMLDPLNSKKGALVVSIIRCKDLMAMDRGGTSDPYVRVKLMDKNVRTHVVTASCDPEFHSNFEFYDVPIDETIHFEAFDKDVLSRDDRLGHISIGVKEIARGGSEATPGCVKKWFALKDAEHGEIQLKLQYIPMDKPKKSN